MYEEKELNEECGVLAIADDQDAITLSYYGLHSLQHRGQEAAGIVFKTKTGLKAIRNTGLVAEVLNEKELNQYEGSDVIGHVQYANISKQGSNSVQPFVFTFFDEYLALAHNGYIGNAQLLKQQLELQGSVFASSFDSEILVHLVRQEHGSFQQRLTNSLIKLDGSFAFVMLHDSGVYGIRDRHGLRPLSIGQLVDGNYVLSSETCAFAILGAKFVRDVEPGEVVNISNNKIESFFYAQDTSENMCLMEYVYFSRPDSSLDETNVHAARKYSGKILANEIPTEGDIVVGVPDSSTSAAIGYAEETGIPYELGLIKNRYVGRTFIQPTQALREKGVRMKLSAVREIVENKEIILIDDSLVRGTTCKRIVQLLKEAGASKVHVRIASPAIKYPCYYGVDISTYEELISNQMDVEQLCEYIKADSLSFLSLEGLENAISLARTGTRDGEKRYCNACFSGKYITSLYEDITLVNKKEV